MGEISYLYITSVRQKITELQKRNTNEATSIA